MRFKKKTVGGEWKENVWYNDGLGEWYFCADLGKLAVWEDKNGEFYTSFSNDQYLHATPVFWSVGEISQSPKDAVIKQIKIA